jgi:uridine kinase
LQYPERSAPDRLPEPVSNQKLDAVFQEAEKWAHNLRVEDVGSLNEYVAQERHEELIQIEEALQEKKIAHIADSIAKGLNPYRLITIAGPSSSGKTTFSQRLLVQLRINGLHPVSLSLDDYFLDREFTPRDEEGNYDFESIDAIDLELFNDHLSQLIEGKEVEVPTFNFMRGCREFVGRKIRVEEGHPLIIEGIHGLNERLTQAIPREQKYKIYISALTQLNLDRTNRIPTTDNRLLRRIVRDNRTRNHSAVRTLEMWESVRRGEERNIFPYQEEADVMFNSALIYELPILRYLAEPLLKEIDRSQSVYSEAKRLLHFLHYFLPIEDFSAIPKTSIIKEFIG